MWQKTPRAQERARAKRKGSYPTKKQQEFLTTPICSNICCCHAQILPKAIKVEREPLKGKSGKRHADREMDEDANGERFAWRKGKCKQTRCRFNHACATCGASDHHSGVCPRKDKGQAKKGRKVQGSRLWKWMRRSLQHLPPMRCWVWIFGQVKLWGSRMVTVSSPMQPGRSPKVLIA